MNAVDVEIDHYLAAMREALADLPAEVRDDLLDDLRAHFAELLSEHDGGLVERLGAPEAYAAELRAAAGLDPGGGSRRVGLDPDLVERIGKLVRTADVRVGRLIGYPRASDFGRKLQPAWWVMRAYLVAWIPYNLGGNVGSPLRDPVGWVLTIVLVLFSIRIGAIPLGSIPRAGRYALSGLVALVALLVLVSQNGVFPASYPSGQNSYDRWSQVSNVFPYDKTGNPLTDVKLYDQNGNALQFGDYWRCATESEQATGGALAPSYPLCNGPRAATSGTPSTSPTPTLIPSVNPSAGPGTSGTPRPPSTPVPSMTP